ncbi:hypothetical protein [Rheinheimera salexigens]|uniref:Lipoprotein n=1 Tax=Rheinheimera salexigens TaxID=1628148 RepID=A0A1E7Q2R6_9GAMM|nr:hypothetical protein [Rheinheimera salexigens]OEY68504.1 hypothetical protein BI198_02165 [Rheinheimera salexigens]
MSKLLLLFFVVISVSSCASHQIADNGCKFVTGTYESEQARKQQSERTGQRHEKASTDIINGILALFTITLSGEKEECI